MPATQIDTHAHDGNALQVVTSVAIANFFRTSAAHRTETYML